MSVPAASLSRAVCAAMDAIAPLRLAGSWDNVGLLVDHVEDVAVEGSKVMVTNDLTEKVVDEAARRGASGIVSYHPTLFRGAKSVTRGSAQGRVLLKCISNRIAVYAPHTSLDAVSGGINDWLIEAFTDARGTPIEPDSEAPEMGMGRVVDLLQPMPVSEALERVKRHLGLDHVRCALPEGVYSKPAAFAEGCRAHQVSRVGVCAGSGGSLLRGAKCDLFLTGEMSHHEILAANAQGITVILTDHTNTERGYLPRLRDSLAARLAGTEVFVSEVDTDPLFVV